MSAKHPVQIDMETVCKNISELMKANEIWVPYAEHGFSKEKILAERAQQRIAELQIIQGKALELKKEIETVFRKQGLIQ